MKVVMGRGMVSWSGLVSACFLAMWGCSEPVESGSPNACVPGEQDCEVNSIIQCDSQGNWALFQLCAPNEICGLASANSFVCVFFELDGQGEDMTAAGKDARGAQSDAEGLPGDIVELDAQDSEEDGSWVDATDDGQEPDELDGDSDEDAVEIEEGDAPSDGSVDTESSERSDAAGDAEDAAASGDVEDEDAAANGRADVELGDGSDGTNDAEDDTGDGLSEEVGACDDEKLEGTFDEGTLQGKLLTAGIACEDQEEFGSLEHANCLRAQFMETGIGPDCASCFSDFVLCFFADCGVACADVDNNPEPCVECKDATTCDDSLNECAGLSW